MLIGGQAVLLHGEPRLTQDDDVTLGVSPDRVQEILEAVEAARLVVLPEKPPYESPGRSRNSEKGSERRYNKAPAMHARV